MGCWENLQIKSRDIVRYLESTVKKKYDPETKEGRQEYLDAANQLRKEMMDDLVDIHSQLTSEKKSSVTVIQPSENKPPNIIEPPKEPPIENVSEDNGGNTVGVSHKSLTDLAKKLGLKDPERGQRLTPEEYAGRGRMLLNAGADVTKLETDFKEGKQPTANDISVARAHLEDLTKIADVMKDKWGKRSKQFLDANKEVDRWITEVVKPMGTAASEPFTALQGERDLDTDSFVTVKRAVEDEAAKPVNEEQEKRIEELTTKNNELKKQGEELEKKVIEETDKSIGNSKTIKAKKTHDDYVKERTAAFQAARDALKNLRTGQAGLGVSIPLVRELTTIAPHITKIVSSLLEEGVNKLGDIADAIHSEFKDDIKGLRRRDIIDLISGDYNEKKDSKINPLAEKLSDIKKQATLTKKLEDLQEGLPENFDKNKTDQTPEVKILLAKIKKVKDDLAAMDYMSKKKAALTPEAQKIKNLEKQRDDLLEGKIKNKYGKPDLKFTDEEKQKVKDLEDEVDDLKKKFGLVKGKVEKPLTEQEQIEADAKELKAIQQKFVDKKDNKFTADESKEIWDYAKKNYLDKGVSYRDMISQVSNDLGLSWRQVSEAITSQKVKPISDAMWKKQSDYRRNQIATKNWVEAQNKFVPFKALRKVSAAFRGVAVFGHGGIFIGTHAGMTLFNPSQWHKVIPAFIRGWKFAYGNRGNYERRIEQLRNSHNYVIAQRAGLKNNPDIINTEEFQKSQEFFKKIGGEAGVKGFNAIKVLRQDLFDYHYNRLSEIEKKDPKSVEQVASLINNATGATNLNIPKWVEEVTFAGGMEAARWGKLTRNPAKATSIAVKALIVPEKATTAERVFAKVWARRVGEQIGTMAGLLVANAAIQSALNPKNPTNLTDSKKADYLKFKFGDITIDPTSGMMGTAKFIYGVGKIPFMDKKELRGDTRVQALGKNAAGYVRGKAAPLYSTMADFFAQQDYNKNPLPFSDDKPGVGHHKLTWGEYAWEKAPLPLAHAAQDMYHSALDNGGDKMTVNHILDGIVSGAVSGGTGLRVGEYNAEENNHSPFTEEDRKDPIFKFWLDKNMELPNTSLSYEEITDEKAGTKFKISDYPKSVQEEYQKEHKEILKKELEDIEKNKQVFVKYYTNKSGEKISSVFINEPEGDNVKFKKVDIDKLSTEEKAQVLGLAQSSATTKAKNKIFYKKSNL